MTIDSLIKNRTIFPTIVVPCGENMGAEHAFCVVDDLIFDSTQPFALTLSKKSLKWICGEEGYVHIYFAVRFQTNFNTKRKLERKVILHMAGKFD